MKCRKAPEGPGVYGLMSVLGFFGLFATFILLGLGFAEQSNPMIISGTIVGVISLIALIIGITKRISQFGPHLLELNSTELRDLQSGDVYHWEDIQSLRQIKTSDGEMLEMILPGSRKRLISIAGLDVPAESIASTAVDSHRRALGKGTLASELQKSGAVVDCPVCHEESDSLKNYHFISLLFMFIAYGWQTSTQVACPSCTRKLIGKNTLVNLLTANITWPFIILPWNLILLLMSLTRGHSKSVVKILADGMVASGHESNT